MAAYYVSTAGSDANNGLGPDASHASNKPWRTIAKALGAAGIASGDTVHIGPGVYREVVTIAMTSAVAETFVKGDPRNTKGFKDGSGNLLAAQPVRWTAWTTDDKTTPAATAALNLSGRDFLTFEDIQFYGASAISVIQATTSTSTNITIRRCLIVSPQGSTSNRGLNVNCGANVALNWTVDSCIFSCQAGNCVFIQPTSSATSEWDLFVSISNCFFLAATAIVVQRNGANNAGGGVDVKNCTFMGSSTALQIVTGGSTTYPCTIYNCAISSVSGLTALNSGEILEDYNVLSAQTLRTNVTPGANSVSSYAAILANFGQAQLWGFLPRQPFSPTFDSPLLGFGTDASVSLSTDLLGRDRPSGPGITWASIAKAVGCYEFHDFATRGAAETGDGWVFTGPGDHDIHVPVDASSTTVSIRVTYDTNHGTGSKPQAELLDASDIGVATETKTATVGVDTYETLTFSAITPTSKSFVTIRLRSRSAAGNGVAKFDTLTVT
jgi:hypothetical protein